jgi:predicted TPR repeat methyltransferase
LEQAMTAHRAGRLDEARGIYQRVLRDTPADPDALHFLGMLEFQAGNRSRGVGLVQDSLRRAPRNPHAWLNLGNMMAAVEGPAAALPGYARAIELHQPFAHAWFNKGICERRLRRFEQALQSLRRTVELQPDYAQAYEALGSLLYKLNRAAEAAEVYRGWIRCEPHNPIARHMLAAAGGDAVPTRAAPAYVSTLFDGFAASFDESLAALGYRAPQLVCEMLVLHPLYQSRDMKVLDAGCGTGLCGPLLRSSARSLVGVDLSERMLERARERGVYDELHGADLVDYLKGSECAFDAIICADTLCYFGELTEVSRAAASALRGSGVFIFTVEASSESPPFQLQAHGRYAHRGDYVREALGTAALEVLTMENAVLRKERGADVMGWVTAGRRGF